MNLWARPSPLTSFSFFKTENGIQCVGDYYMNWCKNFTKYINKKYVTNIFADHYIIDIHYRDYFFLNASSDTDLKNDTITDIIEINSGVLLKNYKTMYDLVAFCNVLNKDKVEFLNEDPTRIRCIYKFEDCLDYNFRIPFPKKSNNSKIASLTFKHASIENCSNST